MNNELSLLIFIILLLSGCCGNAGRMGLTKPYEADAIGPSGPQLDLKPSTGDTIDFEDVSLAAKARQEALTNKREINRETEKYVNNGQAEVISRPDGTILYPYGLAKVILTAKRMMYSKIVLQEGEKIMSAAAGDTVRWNILPDYIGNAESYTPVVLVKPFVGSLQTSLSIITDRRDYDITIQSVDSGDFDTRIGFYYPQDKADAIDVGLPPDKIENDESHQPRINIESIRYDYRTFGDSKLSWYPTGVFEDGNKVFIRMPEHVDRSQLPVFMAVDGSGRAEMVNYRYYKPYYVIDTIFDQGVLMLGTGKYSQIIKLTRIAVK